MFNISDYLKKFVKLEGASALEKSSIESALKEVCGVEGARFGIRKNILYIQAQPIARSIIFTKKSALIASIRSKNPQSRILDIR